MLTGIGSAQRRLAGGLTSIALACLLCLSCSSDSTGPLPPLDDWPTATPASQDLDPDVLDTLTARLAAGDFGLVSSLLIVRNGMLVYEEYFRGRTQHDLHPLHSVTKSFSSAVIGLAVDERKITNLDTLILDFFPQYADIRNLDDRKQAITLRHILQMRAGLAWEEGYPEGGGAVNYLLQLYASDDMFKYVLDLPMTDPPGTKFTYNTGSSMLLSGVLMRVTGEDTEVYAKRKLLDPLGITTYRWLRGPPNVATTGDGLFLRPRDMAKFGQCYLQDGIWEGQRLLSPDWIAESHHPYSVFAGGGYGYQWWLLTAEFDGEGVLIPYCSGWGNQYIFVVHPLNMVVVSTAENFAGGSPHMPTILADYIFAADLAAPLTPVIVHPANSPLGHPPQQGARRIR